tara:strand:- start:51 stop:545 length:495 start_codon:yes stop_codon:yes gene_type:complete
MNIGIAKQEVRTIYGKARWCYLSSPDTAFNKEEYKVDLEVSKADAQEHIKAIKKIIDSEVIKVKGSLNKVKLPYKEEGDVIVFKLHSQFKPKMWDRNQKELGADITIWKDSTMWITFKPKGYNKSVGIGCTLYIQGGQIDKLVQGSPGSNGSCPFPKRSEEATA